ncbi:hypothetical protein KM176_23105 [Pseudooceanicola sp. CBS1P-1]|uniref:GAF domain-containing protein n=1 Tax=Pseudooceanicola albus TaxID=2692189 RepID=A0A6L7GAC4_9RHOB|nr:MULTISPECIES: hypothetical protein [Pseudooceanicola]MBT9386755.1 hypothetical protein [Pseudooceanicola endophyticus]MXN20981.1 hypothetical protein [Pseudooceanicola albus]
MSAPRDCSALLAALSALAELRAATVLRYRDGGAERIWSTHPAVFAAEGFKRFDEAPTMRRVRDGGRPVLTEGRAALQAGFADWQAILERGADAILNLPVRDPAGRCLGQVNLMGRYGGFPADVIARLQSTADAHADCFLPPEPQETPPCA